MTSCSRWFVLLLLLACLAAVPAAARESLPAWLLRGPVLGSLTHDGVTVWIQAAEPVTVRITTFPQSGGAERTSPPVTVHRDNRFIAKIRISGLRPATRYSYRLVAEGLAPVHGNGFVFTTPPPPGRRCRVSIAAGSGAHDWRDTRPRIWNAIAEAQPDLFVALGDTPYADGLLWPEQRRWKRARRALRADPTDHNRRRLERISERYLDAARAAIPLSYEYFRASPGFSGMSRRTVWVATWDDHETGMDNSDRENPVHDLALAEFERFNPNPSFGLPGVPGTFWVQTYGDVEIYLLDDQSYRTPTADADADPAHATILGAAQLEWLTRRLAASTATFKIVACGSPFNEHPRKTDAWATYPAERERLIEAIAGHRVNGVVLLSGDIHRSELYRLPWLNKRGGYPLYELVSSPLYNFARPCRAAVPYREYCAGAPAAHTIRELYGLLTIDTTLADPTLVMEVRNADNEVLLRRTLTASGLSW